MFSDSSSSCEFDDCRNNNSNANGHNSRYQCYGKNPFRSSLREPMVYYAHIPPIKIQNNRKINKSNTNCFVKAFRWYTEDHVEAPRNRNNPDIVGFATWLDDKYKEYVEEKYIKSTAYNLSLKSSSIIRTVNIQHHEVREQRTFKRFTRFKSPWRKHNLNKEAGDVRQKSKLSLQYILHPKELLHPASECFLQSHTPVSSLNTLVCIEMHESKKLIVKSRSLTSVYSKTRNVNNLLIALQDGNIQGIKLLNHKDASHLKVLKANISSKSLIADVTKDVSCQCSEILIDKMDTPTQYDNRQEKIIKIPVLDRHLSTQSASVSQLFCLKNCCQLETQTENSPKIPIIGNHSRIVQEFDSTVNTSCQCFNETSKVKSQDAIEHNIRTLNKTSDNQDFEQPSRKFPVYRTTDSSILKHVATVTKATNSFTILVNDSAQTSDYSIILEQGNERDYPLFMRVIRADKLERHVNN